jgi:plasmid stabilization system protein ParE
LKNLESIAQYIATDSTAYAAAVVTTILTTTRNFSRFPFAGALRLNSATKQSGIGVGLEIIYFGGKRSGSFGY